jgi:hypothetical protein
MKCLTITPWGDCHPAIPFMVLDNEQSGQGLFPLATDLEDNSFVFDVDLMQIAWTDRTDWPLGRLVLDHISQKPGCIVRVNLLHSKKDMLYQELPGPDSAHRAGICVLPGTRHIISELYFLTPGTIIRGKSWSFELKKDGSQTLIPRFVGA